MKKNYNVQKILVLLFAVMGVFILGGKNVNAASVNVQVKNFMSTDVTVNMGDNGSIQPSLEGLTDVDGQPLQVSKWSFDSYNDEVIKVDELNGTYQAIGCGTTTVAVYGYSVNQRLVFSGYCRFIVNIDMTNVSLEKNSVKDYVVGYEGVTSNIKINSPVVLNDANSSVRVTSSNPSMYVSASLLDNQLVLQTSSIGKTTLTVVINDKSFTVNVQIVQLQMSKKSYVTSSGKKVTLRVKKYSGAVSFSSSNTKVAKVSSKGVVRCKKKGNVIITAKIGDKKVGCVVSVVTPKMVQVIKTAKKIGTSWTYSQPKRMQKGFYDCSSLVWKSYSKMGKKFGLANYAPVAADLAKWCAKHGKVLSKSYTSQQVQSLKFRPGDLMFETGAKNGRYKGIYHVEMFVGYAFQYYEGDKPIVSEMWAARPDGYYGGGGLMERP